MATYYPDVSHYHPVSDWSKVKGCPFLISKATEGQTWVDPTLDDFITGCEKNGIPYWLYAFILKGNEKAQAEFLVSTCKSKVGSHFVGYVLDVERSSAAADAKTALDYISGLGKCMLYTGYEGYSMYKDVIANRPSNCAWWEARYGADDGTDTSAKYPCHDGVDLHQFTQNGTYSGISGNCDLNRMCGDKSEAWFADSEGLEIDGKIGPDTTGRWQEVMGTDVDHKISGQTENTKVYWPAISAAVCAFTGGKSLVIQAWQKMLIGAGFSCGNAGADGIAGIDTAIASQKFLIAQGFSCGAAGVDGKFGTESGKALQRWLNAQA